ncbi:MAG: hypothetical protein ACKVS8_01555 [Phycisphaerales bacterium]
MKMVRWLAISVLLVAQLVGVPMTALALCGSSVARACGGDVPASLECCCTERGAPACPCCGGDEPASPTPQRPALPPATKTALDVQAADVPAVVEWTARPAAMVHAPAGDGPRCRSNAKRVQAVLCRWRT